MFYLVRAKPDKNRLEMLGKELVTGKIVQMKPFGEALSYSLNNAKIDSKDPNYALWVEEDYCSPPLAMERESVLDRYFSDITVERVESEQDAWKKISGEPSLWQRE
jgi:hypothetical protein